MTRRSNYVMREFINTVESAIKRNGMRIERAAELMLEHGVPSHITARIIARAQMPLPALYA